jgi:hypothetical protein
MAAQLFEETQTAYRRKSPVKAIRMEGRFTIETRDGIVTGRPGDYIVDALDDGSPWVIPGEVFNNIFYELSPSEVRDERVSPRGGSSSKKKLVPNETAPIAESL